MRGGVGALFIGLNSQLIPSRARLRQFVNLTSVPVRCPIRWGPKQKARASRDGGHPGISEMHTRTHAAESKLQPDR